MNQPGVEGLRPGDPAQIGGYRLLGRLGEGGMGTVYLALAPTGRAVAVKVVKPEFAIEEGFAARFHAEVENARRVASFCTAQVLDNGNDDDGRPYMVTEYIAGTPLSRQITQYGALEPGPLHGVALGVAAALAAIHVAGLVHRDLKPANVILSISGPRVIDFGIARALDSTHSFTRSGEVLGSPGWWAPEQVRGLEITPAADIFAWGCLIAYAGNGRHPYGRGDLITMATRLLNNPPDLGALPAPLNDLVRRATAMDPYQRPTAQDLLIALVSGGIAAPGTAAPGAAAPGARTPGVTTPGTTVPGTGTPGTGTPGTTVSGVMLGSTASGTTASDAAASGTAASGTAASGAAEQPTLIAADVLSESWQPPANVEPDSTQTLGVLGADTSPASPVLDPATPPPFPGPATPPPFPGPGPVTSPPSPVPDLVTPPPGTTAARRTPRRRWLLAGLAVAAAVAVTAVVLADTDRGTGQEPGAKAVTVTDVGRRIATGSFIGDPQLIIPQAPRCGLTSYQGATPVRGRFCAIRWTLLNTAGEPAAISGTPLTLVDDRGASHSPEPVSTGLPSTLAPGDKVDGLLLYDLPPARRPLKLTGRVVDGGTEIEVKLS
ncbi:serine/threonine-protein kinase [Streptosporangium sp. NPDC000396]|uniref:serine/threonine-protein kinase n=1 Tax=Streptosporangium sp. NPDC000396 TaxID=3366185 RepID=UPI0036CD6BC2